MKTVLLILYAAAAFAQRTNRIELFTPTTGTPVPELRVTDSGADLKVKLDSTDLRIYDAAGPIRTVVNGGSVSLRNEAGNQRAYLQAPASASLGGSIVLSNSDGGDKCAVSTANNAPMICYGGFEATMGGFKAFGPSGTKFTELRNNAPSDDYTLYMGDNWEPISATPPSPITWGYVGPGLGTTQYPWKWTAGRRTLFVNYDVTSNPTGYWEARAQGSTITNNLAFLDTAGNAMLTLRRIASSTVVNDAILDGTFDAGAYKVSGTTVINSNRDGSFRNLSFSGSGPYSAGSGISISGSTISASITTCSGGFLVSGVACYAVAAGPGTASYTSGLGISGLKVDFYVESGCVGSARYVNTVQLSAPSTLSLLCDALSNGISASSPISVSGTGAVTISCPTCVTSVSASSPLSASGSTSVTISCPTCFTSGDATSAFMDHLDDFHIGGTSASCGAGEAVKSVTISTAGVPTVSCAVP